MLNTVTIENFTVFRKAKFDFVPGINVLVGANASGKTHLLKLLYAIQMAQIEADRALRPRALGDKLQGIFRPEDISDLIRMGLKTASVVATWNNTVNTVQILMTSKDVSIEDTGDRWNINVAPPVYIPVNDVLAHSIGFLSLYQQRNIDFDETYRDILFLAFTPTLRQIEHRAAISLLSEQLEGSVEVQGERFYLSGKNGRFEMHMVAEGWRKIALLYQLVANASISPGSVLYWDEPDTNLNPYLVGKLATVLLMLARGGTQIFLATHSYFILKELELQKQESDSLRMFAMARNPKDGSVTPHPASAYSELAPNLIADQFEKIYDREIDRALGSGHAR